MDSISDVGEDDPVPQQSVPKNDVTDGGLTLAKSEARATHSVPRPMLTWSSLLPHLSHLAEPPSLSFVSPSKESEVPMEMSPYEKKPTGACQLSSVKPENKVSAKKIFCSKVVNALFTKELDRKESGDTQIPGDELHPKQLFTTSPASPSSEFKAMLDAIEVPQSPEDSEEDFLKRQGKPSLRRCRSLEMRKHLIDMSNTPPGGFKKSTFKRPSEINSRQQYKHAKRPREKIADVPEESSDNPTTKTGDETATQTPSHSEKTPQEEDEEHKRIKTAVEVLESPDLIADGSRSYCLPVITGKHSDLKNINHQTMAGLLSNKFQGLYDKLTVIDCRYPYEYEGGHIKHAINVYTEDEMVEFLNKEVQDVTETAHKHILVFHCEFSSQRGPNLLRHLRKCDRLLNMEQYPQLTFPEVYCLFGGYKDFFLHHPELCEPSAYIPMADEKYIQDLRHFRAKAKSWTAGEKHRRSKKL